MTARVFSFIQEIANHYEVKTLEDGSARIYMEVPKDYRDLAVVKLSELVVTEDEIREFLPTRDRRS